MTYLSPFQTLPLHIAEAIGRYCIGLQRHHRGDIFIIREQEKRIWPVLHDVSSFWMQLACINLNKRVVLRLKYNPKKVKFTTKLDSRRVTKRSTSIIPHIKIVDIYLDGIIMGLYEDEFEKLGRAWPEDLVFPKARSLNWRFEPEHSGFPYSAEAVKYLSWFMERVRSSFPNLQETGFITEQGKGWITSKLDVRFSKEWDTSLFLLALIKSGRQEDYVMKNEIILTNNAPELTSIFYHKGFNPMFVSWLTKKSAATLKEFYCFGFSDDIFKDILFGDDGQVIVYPRLRKLRVSGFNYDKGELTTDKSTVPFPALQRLEMHSCYVFKDDVLFRGSRDTLKRLDIGLDRGFMDVFRKYKVFSQGAYPNLLHISATRAIRDGLTLEAEEFVEAAFGLVSPVTQSIKLGGDIKYQHIASAIPTCPYLENIRIVRLETNLSLLEILDIFKHFPHMTDFGCCFRGFDSELDTIQDVLIPSYIGTQYSQLTSRLKCWHAYHLEDVLYEDFAVLFVTLAVLCPNFTLVQELEYKGDYYNALEHILSSGLYDQHAKRLWWLLEPS